MTDAETYLRELRRALPVGCRRRFVAEVREHFVSAVAAEGDRGVGRADAERLTIERLGPADALAGQLPPICAPVRWAASDGCPPRSRRLASSRS